MEFLMTYGWAILVVLAAIGALAATGVLDMGNLAPDKTTFPTPMLNTEAAVVMYDEVADEIEVQVPFANNFGKTVVINQTAGYGGTDDCESPIDFNATPANPGNNDEFIATWTCPAGDFNQGDKFKADLSFTYKSTTSELERPHSGNVIAKIQ